MKRVKVRRLLTPYVTIARLSSRKQDTFIVRALVIALCASQAWMATASFANNFVDCDGYPAPTKKTDSITSTTAIFGLGSLTMDIRKSDTQQFGTAGNDSCAAALADPLVQPHTLRRTNLLQAKALHLLGMGQNEGALAALQASDELGATLADDWFAGSLLVSNRAVRAYALIKLGRNADAQAEIASLGAARPYSHQSGMLAARLSLMAAQSTPHYLDALTNIAPINPNVFQTLYWAYFGDGQYERALAIAPHIHFELPSRHNDRWEVEGEEDYRYELIVARASLGASMAYARTALNDAAAADELLAQTRRDVTSAVAPPAPPPPGKKPSDRVLADHETRIRMGQRAQAEIAKWQAAVDLRRAAPSMDSEQLFEKIRANTDLGRLGALPDLVLQMQTQNAENRAFRDKFVADWRRDASRAMMAEGFFDNPKQLYDQLLRPEKDAMLPRYRKSGDGNWLSDNGFSQQTDAATGIVTVRFIHNYASRAMLEELAVLRAALLAKESGHDGLVLLSRRSMERTSRTYQGYIGSTTYHETAAGNEVSMRVQFVDLRGAPEPYKSAPARILQVQKVIDDLTPKYARLFETAKPAKGSQRN
jgi:hypothetical protein